MMFRIPRDRGEELRRSGLSHSVERGTNFELSPSTN